MKKILISSSIIAVAAAVVIGATTAYFSDTETSTGNTFTAGTLDLKLWDGDSWENGVSGTVVIGNMAPGVPSGNFNVYIRNFGSMPGKASWNITDWSNADAYTNWAQFNAMNADLGRTCTWDPYRCISPADFAANVCIYSASFDRNGDNIIQPCGADNNLNYDDNLNGSVQFGSCDDKTVADVENWWWGLNDDQRQYILTSGTWGGAPGGIDDEWVLPDWIRWKGGDDYKLSLYEVALAENSNYWTIDDNGFGGSEYLDPNTQYLHQLKFMLNPTVGNYFQAEGINVTVTVRLDQVQ